MASTPLSILDLASVEAGGSIAESFAHSVQVAQLAEKSGYQRIWYAEHHNMPTIASSATAVLIAHIAAHTSTIRLGSGGVMLPNHSPLVIAEQFGTLAELHPGRIDLGLGRAPGTDGATFRALRRTMQAADAFPQDVLELQRYLSDELPRTAVNAYPGRGTKVPLVILGSSMFGASLAAQLGMPYSFASHFAPQQLEAAVAYYRANYQPSEAHPTPYVSAGVNVVAAATDEEAEALFTRTEVARVRQFLSRGREEMLTHDEASTLVDTPAGIEIRGMLKHTAIGGPARVHAELEAFARYADVDELITVHAAPTRAEQLESVRLAAPGAAEAAAAAAGI
ncbi:luciferase family oxidoreductase group 1 [Leucobacter exalbidus]|uniref:Luciferase family oxidoreductase group 1 n=1 Tax=Leucobacter exalbidus TaxID=662960 RepID=A0A940T457_9MICO|nr:LLM class flavin-dependent oxidoreductase [Leucobacter exalbidus]MBP1326882.1 luciferase family oxidoreductase group 1 [Leucobacter exalbidus]